MRTLYLTLILFVLTVAACEQDPPFNPGTEPPVPVLNPPAEFHNGNPLDVTTRVIDVELPLLGVTQEMTVEVVDSYLMIEGDIILGLATDYPNRSATILSTANVWPDGIIPYEIEPGHPGESFILDAIQEVIDETNLCIIPRTNEADYVYINNEGACSSYLGRQGGKQIMRISQLCGRGSAMHEWLHAAGIYHEQSRNDRDTYITVNASNVQPGRLYNFMKYAPGTGLDVGPYDYESIMHYGERAFAIGTGTTIDVNTPPAPSGTTIGQRSRLSAGDKAGINSLYPTASFCGENNRWLVSYGGNTNWTLLNASSYSVDNLLVGDFDMDGRDDVFLADGNSWRYASAGQGNWITLNGSDFPSSELLIGDFDGDGFRNDVLIGNGNNWRISYGGNTNWTIVNGSDFPTSRLLVGNFTGDIRDDILLADGDSWRVSDAANSNWATVNGSNYPKNRLLVGQFNGAGYDDILLTDGSDWRISENANTNWQIINGSDYTNENLLVGHFDQGTTADIMLADGDTWRVSDNANTNWRTINGSDFRKSDLLLGDFDGDGITDVMRHYGQ